MDILTGLAGLLIGAVTAWQLTQWRADAGLARLRAHLEERVCYWQDEAERARATASRVTEQKAAWVAGCQQGREDVLALARSLHVTTDAVASGGLHQIEPPDGGTKGPDDQSGVSERSAWTSASEGA